MDRDPDDPEELEDEHVSPGCGTPASVETPLQSSVSRCTSLNVIRDPLAVGGGGASGQVPGQTPTRRTDVLVSSGVHLSHPATGVNTHSHTHSEGKLIKIHVDEDSRCKLSFSSRSAVWAPRNFLPTEATRRE